MVVKPIVITEPFDDPDAIRSLIERAGPYPSIESYLPASATRGAGPAAGSDASLPWFRGNWAVDGHSLVAGADEILHNTRFIDAASRLFDSAHVTPTTVVVNVNAPMAAGAVHVDIPRFYGAGRRDYPIALLQAMGASGLFEPWRVVEAGAISWFYDGPGGTYDYWPDGLDGPMHSERPPFGNMALVADNDRMYHRIGWIGDPAAPTLALSAGAEIRHLDDGHWEITDAGRSPFRYARQQIRMSILWKAQVRPALSADDGALLSPARVVEIFAADLDERGVDAPRPAAPLSDEAWIATVHETYYPHITVED